MMYSKTDTNIEIHVHPFLGNNTLPDVVNAMKRRGIDVASLETLDSSLFPSVVEQTKKYYPTAAINDSGIILPGGVVLLNGREYNTREGLHLITVGYSVDEADPQTEMRSVIDKALEHGALVVLDHPYVDNRKTRTAGHISQQKEYDLEALCKEYSGQITLEWNGYCTPWIRRGLKLALNILGHRTEYHDVNKKVEELSEKLMWEGYNVPVVADTDLHARTKRHLNSIGTARVITNVEGESATEIVQSMKTNIFNGDYRNIKKYVGAWHLLGAFCFPILLPRYFKNPRS